MGICDMGELTAQDVRSLVEKLWLRCPDCQPESLCWGEAGEDDHGGLYKGAWILRQRETKVWGETVK